MTSDDFAAPSPPGEAFVWIWLPGATEPAVAGRVRADGERFVFNYGRSYLARPDAIPIYEPELPLRPGEIAPEPPLALAGALRDALPDAWGRRVVLHRLTGRRGRAADTDEIDEPTYMLRSGSDRTGALDFQASPRNYVAREAAGASLETLLEAADLVDRGQPLEPDLAEALQHGTSLGGARPKAAIQDDGAKYIAKFSTSGDAYPMVKAEFAAMRLAALAGIDTAPVRLARALGRDVLLVERFDRAPAERGWTRRAMVSALTLLGLDERMARYASYEDLADIARARFAAPRETLRELFARMVFNILVGNTDDHARNHAAFWDGRALSLTPAYDICPQPRLGREASQAMRIAGRENRSQLSLCLAAAHRFLLAEDEALDIARDRIAAIARHWPAVAAEAGLAPIDRRRLWRRQFLNDLAFEGLEDRLGDTLENLPEA